MDFTETVQQRNRQDLEQARHQEKEFTSLVVSYDCNVKGFQ